MVTYLGHNDSTEIAMSSRAARTACSVACETRYRPRWLSLQSACNSTPMAPQCARDSQLPIGSNLGPQHRDAAQVAAGCSPILLRRQPSQATRLRLSHWPASPRAHASDSPIAAAGGTGRVRGAKSQARTSISGCTSVASTIAPMSGSMAIRSPMRQTSRAPTGSTSSMRPQPTSRARPRARSRTVRAPRRI